MKELLITEVTAEQIKQQIELAKKNISGSGSDFPDDTFEDGIISTLEWVFGGAAAPAMKGLTMISKEKWAEIGEKVVLLPILGRPMVESFQIPLQALRRAFKKRGGRSVDQDAREKLGVPALEKFEVSLSLRRCVAVVWAALMGRG